MTGIPQWFNGYGSNPNGEVPGYLSAGLAGLGGGGTFSDYGDMSGWAPSERIAFEGMRSTQDFQKQLLANSAPQKVSPWATGAQTFGSIAQGLSGLGQIYLGYQAMKQQKKAFEFNKGVTNTNLNNSIMDYNRRLGDTLANRALNNGQGQGWVSEQLAKYSAKRS